MRTTVERIDRFASYFGRATAWLIIPMTVAVTWEVVARHFFRAPTIWAFDVVYMLYGTHFMLGTAYTLMRIGHVRTDMLYSRWSIRRQNKIDAIGYFFFFFPAMIFLFYFGWQEAYHSFQIGETSDASPWRPIVWPFKFVIPITALFLLIQGVAELLKSLYAIRTGREWVHREHLEIG
jgi:TRAP-type mannitol/chloroaromatic compound transport system permease small subunit